MIESQANRVSASSCAAASVSTDGRTQGGSATATATAISNVTNITNNITDVLVTALPPAGVASLLLAGTHAAFGFTTRPKRAHSPCGYAVHHRPTPPTHAPHLPSATAKTEKGGRTSSGASTSSGSKTSSSSKSSSSGKSSSSKKTSSDKGTSSSSKTDGPLGFLNDPKMSVEDKLFKFMCYVADKYDKAIEKKMKEIANKQDGGSSESTSGASGSKKKTGGGLLGGGSEGGGASGGGASAGAGGLLGGLLGGAGGAGGLLGGGAGGAGGLLGGLLGGGGGGGAGLLGGLMNTLCPMAGLGAELLGNTGVQDLITQVSGPVMAAGATAFGFPEFAPLLSQIGPQLTQGAFGILNQVAGGSSGTGASGGAGSSGAGTSSGSGAGGTKSSGSGGTKSSGSSGSSSSSGADGEPKIEQKDMMELQQLQNKQQEMFSLVSNMLRAMHDTKMAVINNLRT